VSPARSVLQGVALVAAGRFLVTPTWPCALVALGALVLVAMLERAGDTSREEVGKRLAWLHDELKAESSGLKARIAKAEATASEAQARAERLEANRALGG
jgi:hypothetical protein